MHPGAPFLDAGLVYYPADIKHAIKCWDTEPTVAPISSHAVAGGEETLASSVENS